jgi:hypothetical protein
LATLTKLRSGSWRAQVRRKGRYISETFHRREDARRWATAAETSIDQDKAPKTTRIADKATYGHLIDLHLDDLKDAKRKVGRTKAAVLELLRKDLVSRPLILTGWSLCRGSAGSVVGRVAGCRERRRAACRSGPAGRVLEHLVDRRGGDPEVVLEVRLGRSAAIDPRIGPDEGEVLALGSGVFWSSN